VATDLALLVGIARRHRLEVGARAKITAGAGEHRDRGGVIGVEGKKRVVEFSRGRAVDGVATMWTVDGNDGDGSVTLHEHGFGFGHIRRPPICFYEASVTRPFPQCHPAIPE